MHELAPGTFFLELMTLDQQPFSIEPCYDDKIGVCDYVLMRTLGLPDEWISIVEAKERLGITWIGVREYFWTPDEWFCGMPKPSTGDSGVAHDPIDRALLHEIRRRTGGCFYSLNLDDQTRTLAIPLIELDVLVDRGRGKSQWQLHGQRFARIEDVGLSHLTAQGWEGTSGEGDSACAIIGIIKRAFQNDTRKPFHLYPYHRLTAEDAEAHRRSIVEYVDSNVHGDWIYRALETEQTPTWQPPRTRDAVRRIEATWDGMGALFFRRFVCQTLRTPSCSESSGWPDLTLWKNGDSKLVEVKRNDTLHRNQAYWIRNFGKPLGLDVSVLRFREHARVR